MGAGQWLTSFREEISNQKAHVPFFCSLYFGRVFSLVLSSLSLFFFFVFHNGPFAVFSSCAHGTQLKYDVWIFWETRIVSTKLFKISYRRKKKVWFSWSCGADGGWKRVACLWSETRTQPLYSTRTRHKLPLDPLLFYTCTFTAVLSFIRKKRAAYWRRTCLNPSINFCTPYAAVSW